jgi:hypothetical protein
MAGMFEPGFSSSLLLFLVTLLYLLFTKFRTASSGHIVDVILTFLFFSFVQVELNLKKSDGRSWTLLEKTTRDLGGFQLTFGVGGRTGTIGGKEIIVDRSIQPQANS